MIAQAASDKIGPKGRDNMEERNETLASEVIAAVKKDLVFFKILAALLIFALLAQGTLWKTLKSPG